MRAWIDILFPPRCAACGGIFAGGSDGGFCPECLERVRTVHAPLCRVCGLPFETGPPGEGVCEACLRNPPAYTESRALYVYEGPVLEAVHRFKYGGRAHLADLFGPLLAELAAGWLPELEDAILMPVPLHPRRLRQRGFNQSLLLARHLAGLPGLSLDFLSLQRPRDTIPQASLGREERKRNVVRAFALKNPAVVEGRDVLLVDDVATTGSTLHACGTVLARAGARRVFCLVLARALA